MCKTIQCGITIICIIVVLTIFISIAILLSEAIQQYRVGNLDVSVMAFACTALLVSIVFIFIGIIKDIHNTK